MWPPVGTFWNSRIPVGTQWFLSDGWKDLERTESLAFDPGLDTVPPGAKPDVDTRFYGALGRTGMEPTDTAESLSSFSSSGSLSLPPAKEPRLGPKAPPPPVPRNVYVSKAPPPPPPRAPTTATPTTTDQVVQRYGRQI